MWLINVVVDRSLCLDTVSGEAMATQFGHVAKDYLCRLWSVCIGTMSGGGGRPMKGKMSSKIVQEIDEGSMQDLEKQLEKVSYSLIFLIFLSFQNIAAKICV